MNYRWWFIKNVNVEKSPVKYISSNDIDLLSNVSISLMDWQNLQYVRLPDIDGL